MSNLKKQVTRWVTVLRSDEEFTTSSGDELVGMVADYAIMFLRRDKVFCKKDLGSMITDNELADLLELTYLHD